MKEDLAFQLADLAIEAGRTILAIRDQATTTVKADGSPVTQADIASEGVLLAGLQRLCPEIPIICEESGTIGEFDPKAPYFLVDPLDGTREFIAGRDEFTVNLALIEEGVPVFGIVYGPALRDFTMALDQTCLFAPFDPHRPFDPDALRQVRARSSPADPVALVSRSHPDPGTQAWLAAHGCATRLPMGSSIKFARLARGEADLYARFGPTMAWDIAAGHAILNAAGGSVTRPDGSAIRYGACGRDFSSGPFIAKGAVLPITQRQ